MKEVSEEGTTKFFLREPLYEKCFFFFEDGSRQMLKKKKAYICFLTNW